MSDIIELQNVSIRYRDAEKDAVSNVTLSVPEYSITAIVGESGSGKSTLIRSVIGLPSGGARVVEGSIRYRGTDLTALKEADLRKLRGKSISMIFQNAYAALDPRKKIGFQFLESMRVHSDVSNAEALGIAESALREVGLADPKRILNSYPFELSGGMTQRVAIAMAMAVKSDILLADEPTSALDVTMQAQVVQSLMDLRSRMGTTIVVVTHNLGVASYMADYLAVMYKGRLVDFGPTRSVIHEPKDEYTRKLIASVPDMEVADFEQ